MIFKIHYTLLTAGACAQIMLLGVYVKNYTDASTFEVGTLFMVMYFMQLISKPFICSLADSRQAHRKYMIACLLTLALGYLPFVIIPFLGKEFYGGHPRLCWYILACIKMVGITSYGGAQSLGDTMAVSYAKRVGMEFSRIRIYDTISWLVCGFVIGQINEVSFLPKYTPGFMIVVLAAFLNMTMFWIWPEEYFRVVTIDNSTGAPNLKGPEKDLMTRRQILAHMRRKIVSLFVKDLRREVDLPQVRAQFVKDVDSTIRKDHGDSEQQTKKQIPQMVQFRILAILLRRDLRISVYFLFAVSCGLAASRNSFFLMKLAEICSSRGTCEFSSLVGYLQTASGLMEMVTYYFIRSFLVNIGTINTCAILLLAVSSSNFFYGIIYASVSPYWALLVEPLQGIIFVIGVIVTVEMSYKFSSQVRHIIPELIERGIITKDDDLGLVKSSIVATMQGIVSSLNLGLGRGLGALVYGLILNRYSYEDLWFGCGVFFGILTLIDIAIGIYDRIFKPQLGIKVETVALEGTVAEEKTENK